MNRILTAVVAVLVAASGAAVGGYWNPRGVVPVGDARVPAQLVAWLITGLGGFGGLLGGGSVPWRTWLSGLLQKLRDKAAVSTEADVPFTDKQSAAVPSRDLQRSIVADVPIEVEHLQGCVYHLRVVLKDDEEAQDLLDQIAVKVGRVTADVKGGAA
jgi:hypothetical protein